MSIGKRRPKVPRAQLRSLPSAAAKQSRLARQRARLVALSVVATAVVVCAAIVHGSGPPFSFRLGERPDREIRVNVKEFRIRNQTKTSNERQAAADKVPPSMVNDPAPIKDLADRLDDLTVTIAKSGRFEDVPEPVRSAWKLKPETYLDIKAATATPQRRDNLHGQLQKGFLPLLENGVLGPEALPRNEESSSMLAIHNVGQPWSASRLVPRERVVPERIVKPGGPAQHDFVSAFTTPRTGEVLFQLVADRIDSRSTLTHEPEVTARLRDEARSRVNEHFDTFTKGDVLVEQGQAIGEEQLILLRMEHEAAQSALSLGERAGRAVGILGLVAALFLLTGYYVFWHEPRIAGDLRHITTVCGLVVLCLVVVRLLANQTWNAEVVPVAIAAMILAIAYNPNFALMATFGLVALDLHDAGQRDLVLSGRDGRDRGGRAAP